MENDEIEVELRDILESLIEYQQRRSYESHLISEVELRNIMKRHVDRLDMTRLMGGVIERMKQAYPWGHMATVAAESVPSALEDIKSTMYGIARVMDLTIEMSLSCRLKSYLQAVEELRLHHQHCNTYMQNGLHLHKRVALETEELVRFFVLKPLRDELAQIVIRRLENAATEFANDMYRERFAAVETQVWFKTLDEHFLFKAEGDDLRAAFLKKIAESKASEKAEGDRLRAAFLEKAQLKQPQMLRLININASCICEKVVLEDFQDEIKYSAISHTYGMDVYEVFDCECSCLCFAKVPRCSGHVCGPSDAVVGDESDVAEKHRRIEKDILDMCRILQEAGVEFAWHDGVCIAQHDKTEVEETIKCMGWIYANATETVVFLHYVGKPMAPISNDWEQLTCRWHTRVWTVQEMALSRSRQYCVRVGDSSVWGCNDLREFEEKVGTIWNRVEVITEERFIVMVEEICAVLYPLVHECAETFKQENMEMFDKAQEWVRCLGKLSTCLTQLGLGFPTRLIDVLTVCSSRESKHEGDRMNSVLALVGLKDFVAPKDEDVEEWTIKFFSTQGQQGLVVALFCMNSFLPRMELIEARRHTWAPSLSRQILWQDESWQDWNELEWRVDEEPTMNLELTGELVCVAIRFTLKPDVEQDLHLSTESVLATHFFPYVLASPVIDMELRRIKKEVGQYNCSFAQPPNSFLGSALLQFMVTTAGPYPVCKVEEELQHIREGNSFEAHLVLPLSTLTTVKALSDRPSSSHAPPCLSTEDVGAWKSGLPLGLLVQGELPSVSKIGSFTPTIDLLLQLIVLLELPSATCVTMRNQLVIK